MESAAQAKKEGLQLWVGGSHGLGLGSRRQGEKEVDIFLSRKEAVREREA